MEKKPVRFWVYILFSHTIEKSYIGHTQHLQKRLRQHNLQSNNGWTARGKPWVLIHKESFVNRAQASDREKYYKSFEGRARLNIILDEFKNTLR